jgi:hypothetical protein
MVQCCNNHYRLRLPQVHSATGRTSSIESSRDLIWNRIRDLQACSRVPQSNIKFVPYILTPLSLLFKYASLQFFLFLERYFANYHYLEYTALKVMTAKKRRIRKDLEARYHGLIQVLSLPLHRWSGKSNRHFSPRNESTGYLHQQYFEKSPFAKHMTAAMGLRYFKPVRYFNGALGSVVVKALCYKPVGRGFHTL